MATPEGTPDTRRLQAVMAMLLLTVGALAAADLVLDAPTRWLSAHVVLELALVAVSLGGAIYLGLGWNRAAGDLDETRVELAARRADAAEWQRRATAALEGLGQAIDEQFTAWHLTPAEREVALALLRGLGHKQIAGGTGRSERTVRQHAVAVYEKAGLSGRAELAAFFLEGLRTPPRENAAE